ncbi:uncharacterized protein [Blastocystis hominis]|uniref:RRM domain-containing protein n=1 Tax=Blastocystis hominis TaxID=12968 RepID=D8LUR5_BLAHO|nr:uncharacterized protein [Blastocystis hominis]CBK19554.2 unnamed protein product [Blastocystis hominis]|eukprot:XP_012893602.1 uncharacterized protein [Blastocystis hominis]
MSNSFSAEDVRDLLSKISKLEENYRLKQMELETEIEKHKKTRQDMEKLRGEVAILVEEKIRLCEKVGALTESCSLKDRSYEVLKKDLDKRLTELRVLEHRFSEESEAYKKKRESFRQEIDQINEKMSCFFHGSSPQDLSVPLTNEQIRNHELYRMVVKEKEEQDESMKSLKKEFSELSEYLNKLESGYSQSLEYINHLEGIISHQSERRSDEFICLFYEICKSKIQFFVYPLFEYNAIVEDIPYKTTGKDLVLFFLPCVKPVSINLSMREDKNLNNGYGFIEFKSIEECTKAIQYCKREAFCGERLTAKMAKDAMKRDEEAESGATTDDSKPIYLKEFTDEELHSKLQKLGEVAKRNPIQAQRLLQQNPSFLNGVIGNLFQQTHHVYYYYMTTISFLNGLSPTVKSMSCHLLLSSMQGASSGFHVQYLSSLANVLF